MNSYITDDFTDCFKKLPDSVKKTGGKDLPTLEKRYVLEAVLKISSRNVPGAYFNYISLK